MKLKHIKEAEVKSGDKLTISYLELPNAIKQTLKRAGLPSSSAKNIDVFVEPKAAIFAMKPLKREYIITLKITASLIDQDQVKILWKSDLFNGLMGGSIQKQTVALVFGVPE